MIEDEPGNQGATPAERRAKARRDGMLAATPIVGFKGLSGGFRIPLTAPASLPAISDIEARAKAIGQAQRKAIEEVIDALPAHPGDFVNQTAENTERMTVLLEGQHSAIHELVSLTAANLELSEQQRVAAARSQRFSVWISLASLITALASLGAAVAALVTSA